MKLKFRDLNAMGYPVVIGDDCVLVTVEDKRGNAWSMPIHYKELRLIADELEKAAEKEKKHLCDACGKPIDDEPHWDGGFPYHPNNECPGMPWSAENGKKRIIHNE